MVSSTYRTGSWLGIVRSGSVIVLESNTNPAIVNRLWDFLGEDPTIHGVLNAVTAEFGTGLTGLPHFAILVQSDKLHAILRGDITLVAQLAGSAEVVSGRDVSTWSERSLQLPESLELTLADDAGDVLELPIDEAVVRLQALRINISQGLPTGFGGTSVETAGAGLAGAAPAGTDDADAPAHSGEPAASAWPAQGDGGFAVVPADGWAPAPAADAGHTAGPSGFGPSAADADAAGNDGANTDTDANAEGNGFDDTVAGLGSPDTAAFETAAFDSAGLGAGGYGAVDADGAGEPAAEFAAAPETVDSWAPEAPSDAGQSTEFSAGFAGGGSGDDDAAISLAKHDWFSPAGDGAADETGPDAADDGEEDAYAGFAMAAEAADAEWSAQLAPVEAIGADEGNDLNLTMRPEQHDDEFAAGRDGEDSGPEDSPGAGDAGFHNEADTPQPDRFQAGESPAQSQGEESAADQSPADEESFTTNYDHLWGPTVARSVEDAAVRLDENGQPLNPGQTDAAHAEPMLPPLPPLPPLAGSGEDTPAHGVSAPGGAAPFAPDAAFSSGDAFTAPDVVQGGDPLMIDSVPWGNPAARAAAQAAEQPAAAADFDPDHDGQTVMSSDFRRDAGPAAAEPLESRPPTGPMVLARMCPHGHANPPSRSQCSDCGAPINSEPREVGRPRLGTMHISSGESVELDHSLIIGRQPSVSRVMGGAMPRLVQVKSGNDDISRSHVEVRLDGWDVLLVDLKATNGTVLVREGQAPRRLSQGEEAILLNGDIAELGDGISLLFDGLL